MQINFGLRTVSCKIVYYGPGLSGKTTNIQRIHEQMPGDRRGELTSIKTKGDRTLFFDFMAFDLGKVAGMDTRFQIYTVPGQVYYNATRKLVLQGADGVVFVADSSPDRMQANIDSWRNLEENLAERRLTLHDLPVVVQWNKRDLPDAVPTDQMNHTVNTIGAPTFESVASRGEGVLNTLKCICTLVSKSITVPRDSAFVPPQAEARVTEVPAAAELQPVAAEQVRFTSRRIAASARPAVSATTLVAIPTATAAAETEEIETVSPHVTDDVPTPPMEKRRLTPFVTSPSAKPFRSARGRVILTAAAIAAAVGAAVLLYALGIW